MIARALRTYRIWKAQRRLQKLVDARRQSFEVIDYRKRRDAALRGLRRA